ncbi:hypothetical protein GEV49_15400 [Streptomyces sp. SYP-A7193]|nr:hypothetical protein GEV49_15400 [Streptomyces sp. SYP-A7193]
MSERPSAKAFFTQRSPHFIAPPRAFTQFSHDLIRHSRLSSDAVRLLTWQLSHLGEQLERFGLAQGHVGDELLGDPEPTGPLEPPFVHESLVLELPLGPGEGAATPWGLRRRSPPSASHRRSSAFGSRAPSVRKAESS